MPLQPQSLALFQQQGEQQLGAGSKLLGAQERAQAQAALQRRWVPAAPAAPVSSLLNSSSLSESELGSTLLIEQAIEDMQSAAEELALQQQRRAQRQLAQQAQAQQLARAQVQAQLLGPSGSSSSSSAWAAQRHLQGQRSSSAQPSQRSSNAGRVSVADLARAQALLS